MELRDAYRQKLAAQLKEWRAEVKLLEAKAENAGAGIQVKNAKVLQELHAKLGTASEKIQDLEKASGEAWDQVKETADKIWEDLKQGFADAHSKFK